MLHAARRSVNWYIYRGQSGSTYQNLIIFFHNNFTSGSLFQGHNGVDAHRGVQRFYHNFVDF